MVGKMVKSKAGHDKDNIYFVIALDNGFAKLTDGKIRMIDNPKKKNVKHLQVINKETAVGQKIISSRDKKEITYTNEEIKREIKLFINNN